MLAVRCKKMGECKIENTEDGWQICDRIFIFDAMRDDFVDDRIHDS